MKISMILTSLIVAMSAMNLTACDNSAKTDAMEQSQEMKDKANDNIQPEPTPPPE